MNEERARPAEPTGPSTPAGQPPRIVLYVLYAVLVAVLLAVFVIVGVYGA